MWTVRKTLILAGAVGGWAIAMSVASCGGGSTSDDAGADTSTQDVQKEAAIDTGVKDSGPAPCAVDADLNTLQIPDATLEGGINTGVCWGCLKGSCQTYINQCNTSCDCKQGVLDFLDCMGKGGQIQTCAAGLATIDPNFALQFGGCAYGNCQTQCGLPNLGDAAADAKKD